MLQAELSRLPLPQPAADEIKQQLGRFPEGTAFSVRSSSTMEDLASAAFAGQHETFLNVVGASEVLDCMRGCFVSLWADRAIAYRHQQGFDHAQAAMAVVVQQMVPSQSAGVGFSINPVNGQLGEMVINANFGLGESVVSGEGEVDQWILDKATRVVRSVNIASKSRQVVSAASGTREVHLAGADAAKPSLICWCGSRGATHFRRTLSGRSRAGSCGCSNRGPLRPSRRAGRVTNPPSVSQT